MEMQEIFEELKRWLPLLLPLIVLQYGFMVFAIIDIAKKKATKNLSPLIWILISVVFNNLGIGSILYFILGRADAAVIDDDDI